MNPLDHPSLFSPLCLVGLLVTVLVGMALRQRRPELVPDAHVDHFNALETSVLSMFALMLGFSFSMAVSRLEYRRNLQIDEANAISRPTCAPRLYRRTCAQQHVTICGGTWRRVCSLASTTSTMER